MVLYKIETKNLTKELKGEKILKNINMKVSPNEVYGLLGINGAGKSTLMKVICGIIFPTSGQIFLDGQELTRSDLSYVGALIETPPTYNHLSAQDNLKVVALNENINFEEIDRILEIVNLKVDKKKKVKDFSLGMKQRLGIAMVLIKKPKLILLDEPSNGLDPYGIQELRELLKQLTKDGASVIISSHILSEIQLLADHIGIIHNGRLEYQEKNDSSENLEEIFFNITKGGR
ncbi:lantibiotic ABC transporter ATP-binding protein [Staphylococcus felis]|uniref:Lantibiotic protection ABC transporter ATP-binding subunit n=1 Tax=Staphylococcus felis TaxID=46127 RepID=A0ABS0QRX4_9STAP|nr:lantibiotic protection ABC transporter ATP-binding subunit [Staphylococcus felis]MBH9582023.1 lantibiotic protection ABC transporter ATP-binding subunit [Staphylococcus felis]REH92520.1 lantibiotic ABC transporter ATP-binding protein [Staphylococcus felis]